MAIDNKKKVIQFNFHSDVDDCDYIGQFTIKRMSLLDYSRQATRKLELSGGYHYTGTPGVGLDQFTNHYNEMLSHLELAITASPEWWVLDEIYDIEVLQKVYQEVLSFENSFLARRRDASTNRGQSDGVGAEGSSTTGAESIAGAPVSQVVEQEIPAALQP